MMLPLIPHMGVDFWTHGPIELLFFNSASSAFAFLAASIKKEKESIFLLPAYTCPSVCDTLDSVAAEYDFVDIDDMLGFDADDLADRVAFYADRNAILLPTSLFGAPIFDYKAKYPHLTVIEDRAQSLLDPKSNADYQFTSFGKGKMISGFGGGALFGADMGMREKYMSLSGEGGFVSSYLATLAQELLLPLVWPLLKNSRLNDDSMEEHSARVMEVKKMSTQKQAWLTNTLSAVDMSLRKSVANKYIKELNPRLLYGLLQDTPYLRFPIKKIVDFDGVSRLVGYRATYKKAVEKRGKELDGARKLAFESSFLPSHHGVNEAYMQKIIERVNQ